ncbi:MAG: HAD family hydrolase [Calditrichia bacterium]
MKLILFDIDGTLLLTGGRAAGLMAESAAEILRKPVHWDISDFVGNTDRQILFTLLRRSGAADSVITDLVEDSLNLYLDKLDDTLSARGAVKVLPGVKPLLKKMQNNPGFALGVLTGNVKAGAEIKLKYAGLLPFFKIGAYGDDAANRNYLPRFVIQRAEKHFGRFFEKKDIWIIGDSLNDIRCAHANHLQSLAVATGYYSPEQLKALHPIRIIDNFNDTQRVLKLLEGG